MFSTTLTLTEIESTKCSVKELGDPGMNAQTGNISQTFHLYLPDLTCETEKNPFTRVGHTYTFARFSFHLSRITSCGRKKITSITRNRHFTLSRAWLNDSKACLFDRNVL